GVARQARSPFLQLVAVGLTFVTVITAYLHVGVVIGLLPTTGLTLPFVSYGRSNIVLTMFLTGVLVNIGSTKERVIGSGADDPLALPATCDERGAWSDHGAVRRRWDRRPSVSRHRDRAHAGAAGLESAAVLRRR